MVKNIASKWTNLILGAICWTRDLVKDVAILVENVKRARSIALESILGQRDTEDQWYTGTVPWLSHQIQFEVYATRRFCLILSIVIGELIPSRIEIERIYWMETHHFYTRGALGRFSSLLAVTARYVRGWQCHSRNILEEKSFVEPFSEMRNACTYRRKREIGAEGRQQGVKFNSGKIERRKRERVFIHSRRSVYTLTYTPRYDSHNIALTLLRADLKILKGIGARLSPNLTKKKTDVSSTSGSSRLIGS